MATRPSSLPELLKQVLSESLSPCSDRQLLERFADTGDETAFAAIVDRHGSMLLALCRRLLGDSHLADDVLQATFLVLARKARSIRRGDSLAGWLYGVAQRLARQARLAELARSRREQRVALDRKETAASDSGWDELLRVLDEELRRLPERYRAPLLLCYLEGRTQDEAAKQLDWSLSTLRRRLEDARELLKARMIRRGATLGAALFGSFLAPTAVRAVLTEEVREAVLTTALSGVRGVAVPASILVLANGVMRMATLTKIALWSILLVTAGGVLAGVILRPSPANEAMVPPQTQPEPPANQAAEAPQEQQGAGRDRFNQLLPEKAVARLGTVTFRHGKAPSFWRSLAFTPDGKHLVSLGGGWLRRWDVATGQASVNLGDGWRSGRVDFDLLASVDGKVAYICRNAEEKPSGTILECTEFDFETGKERRKYRHEFTRVTSLPGRQRILLSNGKTCAEVAQSILLWNVTDGSFVQEFKLAEGRYTAMVFPPGGKTVLGGDDAHTIHVLDLATGKELRSFGIANVNGVSIMAVSPDGKRLVTHSWADGFLRVWNLDKGTEERTLDFADDHGVGSLLFTPDGRTLIAGISIDRRGSRNMIRTWDAATGKPGREWTDDPTIGFLATVSPDGKVLATMNDDGVIRLWDMETGKEKRPVDASPCSLAAVCFQPDGKTLLTIGSDAALREWDAATGRLLGPPRAQVKGTAARFTAGGKLLLSDKGGLGQDVIRLTEPVSGKVLEEGEGDQAVVSADGKRLAITDKKGGIQVFDIETRKLLQTWAAPEEKATPESPLPVARGFSADGQSLIVQGEIVAVRDVQTGKQRTSWSLRRNKVLEKPEADVSPPFGKRPGGPRPDRRVQAPIESVAVSPDGSRIAFGLSRSRPAEMERGGPRTESFRIMILETRTGKLVHQTDVDDENIRELTFSPDGKFLAAGFRTIRVWEVGTEKAIWQFDGHRGRITSLAFSADGKQLASASEDSSVLIWDVAK